MPTTTLAVNGYKIFIRNSFQPLNPFLAKSKFSKLFILVDENTKKHCLPLLLKKARVLSKAVIIEIPSGEKFKNIDTTQQIWKQLMEAHADRKSLLANLGGGVIGDMGGWAAVTFKRGVDFIQIPTTLLSQVDASIGGKLGIDVWEFKNLVGTFHNPKAVFIFPEFLKTLPEREIKSGFAEIIKHALIADKKYWERIKKVKVQGKALNWEQMIIPSLKIKKAIVEQDPQEKSRRKVLNFGHTVGHALESYFLQRDIPLSHGEAVAAGMICESFLSHRYAGLSKSKLKEIADYIFSVYGLQKIPVESFSEVLIFMQQDKKNQNGAIQFTLLKDIGKAVINQPVSVQSIVESLQFYRSYP